MKRLVLCLLPLLLGAEEVPVAVCDTGVPKDEAEVRAVACPEGYVGQWFQERSASSCDWAPKNPQWYACSQIITPVGGPPTGVDPNE